LLCSGYVVPRMKKEDKQIIRIMEKYKFLAVALALLPMIGVGLSLGRIFSTLLEGIARNPSAKDDLTGRAIIGFALTESIALLSFVVAMLILFSK
jgi:F-type H+-transporting ATPase subunit c